MAISLVNSGTWASSNATTHTVSVGTPSVGDMVIIIAACKAATITSVDPTITTPASGWTRIATFADGVLGAGNGTGSVHQAIFYKIWAGGDGNPTITWGGSQTAAPGIVAFMYFSKAAGDSWVTPVAVQKATNSATSISVTMDSNPGITVRDVCIGVHTTRDDSALTSPNWTATSVTRTVMPSTATPLVAPISPIASATSNDMAGTGCVALVTSGTASANPVVTGTQGAAETGVTGFIRLRVTPTSSTYRDIVIADIPKGYWRLGEASGTAALDEMFHGIGVYNATPTLGAVGAISGDSDTAVTLDGTEWVSMADNELHDLTGPFSIEAWVKSTGSIGASGDAIWGKGTGSSVFVWVTGTNSSPVGRVVLSRTDVADVVVSSAVITDTAYHHVVVTYSNGVESNIYVDSVSIGGSPSYGAFGATAIAAGIGSKTGSSATNAWHGTIDDVAIYDRVLSAAEVLEHYTAGAPPAVARVVRATPYPQILSH